MRICQASAWAEVATFLIKRKWPKKRAAPGFHSSNTPVAPEVRASLSLPRESDKERPGSPPGPRAGRQPSNGGCRPGLPLDSRPNPGLHWPPGRIGAPCAAGPGRGASAQPATGRGRFWADVSPLDRVWEMGPKRQPGTAANLVAGQAAGPLEKPGASQNPTVLPGGERRLGTGHETNGGPSRSPPGPRAFCGRPAPSGQVGPHGGTSPPMCPPALRGGNQFAQRSGANCEPAGATPPPVNLWPLSFDQESGDTGVGLLPDNFSNHRITHGTR